MLTIVDRLKKFKSELGLENNKEMATLLKIGESFYSSIESGKKPVSKNVLQRLVVLSKLPEEYWKYGITDEVELIEKREEFKCLKDAIIQLSNIGLLKSDSKDFSSSVEEVLIAAMKADVTHILDKQKIKKETIKGD
ncbi:helix-turn-helix domain-containing protein [Clostridium estertheticum]|uniref:helix-turn-helix domain-containing protein n=1 Tax=Clostridium estertheticum TaxID=238834 RepID=UPI0019D5A85B|nr:helix-turn-helix transcriptional regulator [Clostridium estertheticum]